MRAKLTRKSGICNPASPKATNPKKTKSTQTELVSENLSLKDEIKTLNQSLYYSQKIIENLEDIVETQKVSKALLKKQIEDLKSKEDPGSLCRTCEFKDNCPFNLSPTKVEQLLCEGLNRTITTKSSPSNWSGLTLDEFHQKSLQKLRLNVEGPSEPEAEAEIISIDGKQFKVFPSLHFADLINAAN